MLLKIIGVPLVSAERDIGKYICPNSEAVRGLPKVRWSARK